MPDLAEPLEFVQIEHENGSIRFAIKRSPRRKTFAVILHADGVHIAVPLDADLEQVRLALQPSIPRILQRAAPIWAISKRDVHERSFVSGESLRLLGKPYILWISPNPTQAVHVKGNRIYVGHDQPDDIKSALENWYKAEAKEIFAERVPLWAKRLGVMPGKVIVRSQKARWGSCDSMGNLRLNWRLVMAPMSLIDYVIAHELTHLRAPNHSPQFWQILRSVMPDYLERKQRLDCQGRDFYLLERPMK